jgi:cytochrome c6
MRNWKLRLSSIFLIFAAAILITGAPVRAQDAAGLYKSKCAGCHGADGKGDTPVAKKLGVRDFASPEVQKETDQELIDITTKGKNKMPGYGSSLKDTQIKDLVAYIRDLAKKK